MYYPLSEIIENQYTDGNEYVEIDTLKPYKGYYYLTTDGKVFSGSTYSPTAKELIKLNRSLKEESPALPSYHVAIPTEEDYKAGYMLRYVTKRVNSGPDTIKEVTRDDYQKTISNPLYTQASFVWILSGPLFDDTSNPHYPIYGVISNNRMTIENLEKDIPGISNFFSNYSQYAR
jgi:hypothetical protein